MRKEASDPKFMALKKHKKDWNKATKELISRIIAFKKGLNGTGDSKYGLPTSKLTTEMPNEVANFLNYLNSNYEAMASEALKIIHEQNEFAISKHKKASFDDFELNALASSKLSRFWTYLKYPFSSDQNKKIRISLLGSLASLEDLFKKFERALLKEQDLEAYRLFDQIFSNFSLILNTLESFSESSKLPIESEKTSSIDNILSDLLFANNISDIDSNLLNNLSNLVSKFKNEKDNNSRKELESKIETLYKDILNKTNIFYNEKEPSFQLLFKKINDKPLDKVALAQDFFNKLLKKKLELKPTDSVGYTVLNIVNWSEDTRKTINELMTSLEKSLDLNKVFNDLQNAFSKFQEIKDSLRLLLKVRGRSYSPDRPISNIVDKKLSPNELNRLTKKYDTLTDRKMLDLLFK